MSDSGPTTAGSIVGKLSLDKAQWDADVAAAKRQAEELGNLHPTVKVDADVAEALAKLEEVRAASGPSTSTVTTTKVTNVVNSGGDSGAASMDSAGKAAQRLETAQTRLANAARASANAANMLEVAELRLAAVEDKAGSTDVQVASAQAQVERARMNATATDQRFEAQMRKTAQAAEDLATAQERGAGVAVKLAAAQDTAAAATDKQGRAANNAAAGTRNAATATGLIAAGIAVAIPLIGDLAGALVGIGGGFLGMGAAGVLAFLGVKQAMSDGTAAGDQFDAGLQILKGDMQQLEQTAASGVLAGFLRTVDVIDQAMPHLNDEIGTFANQLGTTTAIIMDGIVTAFQVMNPLFVQGAFFVEQLAAGFSQWTHDGGLAQFTQMAIGALPQVTNALGSLVGAVVNLVAAFAPLGGVMLGALSFVGLLVSGIAPLLGNLAPLAAVAGLVYGAFLLWKQLSPIIDNLRASIRGFGTDLTLIGGIAGLAVAAIGYIASSFVMARLASSQAADALQNYTAAVQQDNGVIGDNVKAQNAKALADKNSLGSYNSLGTSAIDIGRRLGISATTVTEASLGQHAAILKVNQAMTDYANNPANSASEVAAFRANWINLTGVITDNQKHVRDAIKAYNDVRAAQGLTTISTQAQLQAQQDLAARYGMSLPALLTAQGAQQTLAAQTKATTQAMQMENDAAGLLTQAFTLLNKVNLDVAQAQTAAAAATNTLTDSLSQNGLTIDGNSKAAVANQQALQQKALADQQASTAVQQQTHSTEKGTEAFAASKQALIDQLTATHQLTPAIQALIDKYYAVPPVVKTQAELDADAAMAKLAALKAAMNAIHDQTVTLTVVTNNVGAPATMPANTTGGPYKFADGGSVHAATGLTVPGAARPYGDSVHMLLAPSEEVISNRNGQADRNRGLLKLVNSGADSRTIANYAGGSSHGTSSEAPIIVTVVNKTGVTLSDLIDIHVSRDYQQSALGFRSGKQKGQ